MPRRLPASILFLSLGLALLTLLPYAWAAAVAGPDRVFAGFLLNPLDGATYLAKIRQGWQGDWLFTLPFTADPGPGSFLFIYYLLIGHLARLLDLPLLIAFHGVRVVAGFVSLITLWHFAGAISTDPRTRRLAWWVMAIGSGLGWIAALAGGFTADLWVAEFIPFLSIFSSAHFPLALTLLLCIAMRLALPARAVTVKGGVVLWLLAGALAILQPFALIPLVVAAVLWAGWMRWKAGRFPDGSIAGLALIGLAAAPWLVYDLLLTRTHPQLALWAAQNLTPTPPVWDVALSTGLVGVLALVAIVLRIMRRPAPSDADNGAQRFFLVWAVSNALLLYAPLALQRRLMMGWFFPLVGLAVPLLAHWIWKAGKPWIRILAAFVVLVPSHVLLMTALAGGVARHEPVLFLTRDEAAALAFLAEAPGEHPVALASPEFGMFIPGWSSARVIYGHPMETPNAVEAEHAVTGFYTSSGAGEQEAFVERYAVDYIIVGPRERALGGALHLSLPAVFQSGDVIVYSTAGLP
jgi:hypothetical protein